VYLTDVMRASSKINGVVWLKQYTVRPLDLANHIVTTLSIFNLLGAHVKSVKFTVLINFDHSLDLFMPISQ